jgi:DNA-binding transcriptional ArsR family regulator
VGDHVGANLGEVGEDGIECRQVPVDVGDDRDPHLRHAIASGGLDRQASTCLCCCSLGALFKALADPTRRKILDELTERDGQTLFEICSRLATKHQLASSRQAISQHLDLLEAAGLVETRREGRYKFHHINTRPLEHIVERWLTPRSGEGAS